MAAAFFSEFHFFPSISEKLKCTELITYQLIYEICTSMHDPKRSKWEYGSCGLSFTLSRILFVIILSSEIYSQYVVVYYVKCSLKKMPSLALPVMQYNYVLCGIIILSM